MELAVERRDEDRLTALRSTVDEEVAPERRVGGGGGGLLKVEGGADVVGGCSAGERGASGWDDIVAAELLRERASDDLSWLCRRAMGGVGGLRRCGAETSGVLTGGEFSIASSEDSGDSAASLAGTGSTGDDEG